MNIFYLASLHILECKGYVAFSSLCRSCCLLISRRSYSSPDLYLRDVGPLIELLCITGRAENQTWSL